ncbi:Ig-like domain-containing protein [Leptospira interrogans]|uniref:Ig-like domain-containing protein n=1 Tax=Leptospira interrogans TaxID=173 RepID=UPI003CF134BA
MTVVETKLVSIDISPSPISKAKGSTLRLKAIGKSENGNEIDLTEIVTWYSSDPKVVSISNADNHKGLANALSIGSSKIFVDYYAVPSNTIDFKVTPEILASEP